MIAYKQGNTGHLINACQNRFTLNLTILLYYAPLSPVIMMVQRERTVGIDWPVSFVCFQANGHSFVHMEHEKAVLLLKSFQNTVDLVIQRELTV